MIGHTHPCYRWFASIAVLVALLVTLLPAAAQLPEDCGVVDTIIYPVGSITRRGDDFGIFRGKFDGLHTGVDLAFYRYGDPVYAVARGRVTYANTEGWDTEKGVVIVEHTFPDGSVFYSLYGHMEAIGDYFFPGVGQCVEPGDIVGAEGDPSLSAPHLHFEIRDFLPTDGGPGYVNTNPLELGWEHPLDFIHRWQIRLGADDQTSPYISHVTALNPPSVPPLVLPDGSLITAAGSNLEGVGADGELDWRMELSDTVTGMVLLPDGRTLIRVADGTILLIQNGRYQSRWLPDQALTGAPMLIGDAVAFFTEDNALRGYMPDGVLMWGTPPLGDRVGNIALDGDKIAVGTLPRTADITPSWHLVSSGQLLYQVAPANPPQAVFGPDGSTYLLDGATLYRISADFTPTPLARLPFAAGRSTALTADAASNVYIFMALDNSLLYAYDPDGNQRWETVLPGTHRQPPLLAAGDGCLLYALATDGTLFAINTADGAILGQARLYSGGSRGNPNARLLDVLDGEQVRFGAGYLTVMTVDGYALAGLEPETCPASGG